MDVSLPNGAQYIRRLESAGEKKEKSTYRPYGGAGLVEREKINEILDLFSPTRHLKAFKSTLPYCHRLWSVCADTQNRWQ